MESDGKNNLCCEREESGAGEVLETTIGSKNGGARWLRLGAKYFLHALWMLMVGILGAEMILRAFDPIGLSFFDELKAHREKIRTTPDGYYNYHPGDQFIERGNVVSINNEGFRADDLIIQKPEGIIRVLCLGDSMVFGSGVAQDAPFWAVLEKMALSEGYPCEIIPAGASSWNTVMEGNFFSHRGIDYSPDIVLLLIHPNDLWSAQNAAWIDVGGYKHGLGKEISSSLSDSRTWRILILDPFGSAARMSSSLAQHSYMVGAYKHFRLLAMASKLEKGNAELDPKLLSQTKSSLQEIVSLCNSRKIQPLFFIGVTDGKPDCETMYRDFYFSELERLKAPANLCVVNFRKRSLRISLVDAHPTALGHQVIAQSMYPHLRAILATLSP